MFQSIRRMHREGRIRGWTNGRGVAMGKPVVLRRERRPELERLEPRQLLATVQDFDTPGTAFTLQQVGLPPRPAIVPGGPFGSFLRLTSASASLPNQLNSISFVRSDPGSYNRVVAEFDFRITPGFDGGRGDGLGFALLNTANFGTSGPQTSVLPERALFDGSLGIGFDTNQGAGDTSDNAVIVSFNSAPVEIVDIPKATLDLASGVFIRARVEVDFSPASSVSVVLTPAGGAPLSVVRGLPVPGLNPYEARVNHSARAVSSLANIDIDNVNVVFSGLRLPGTVSFAEVNYVAAENQGVALIDVIRTGGASGSVTVSFAAVDGTARHGVNYLAVAGTLQFAEGQTIQTVVVPIFDDGVRTANKTVRLFLGNPDFSAPLVPPIQATLTIVDTDPGRVAPTVNRRVQPLFAAGRRLVGLRLRFSQPMDPATVSDLANYQVASQPFRNRGPLRSLALAQAIPEAGGLGVRLLLAPGGPRTIRFLRIEVRGRPPGGLTNTLGALLDGAGSGEPGSDAVLTLAI